MSGKTTGRVGGERAEGGTKYAERSRADEVGLQRRSLEAGPPSAALRRRCGAAWRRSGDGALRLAYFSFSLGNVGFEMASYPVTFPAIALCAHGLVIAIRGLTGRNRLKRGAVNAFLLFFLLAAGTEGRGLLSTRAVSLLLLALFMLPSLAGGVSRKIAEERQRWFLRGQYLNWAVCSLDFLSMGLAQRPIGELVGTIRDQPRVTLWGSQERLSGLMPEPSQLALFLAFGIVAVLENGPRKRRLLFCAVNAFWLICTGSISAIAVLMLYLALRWLKATLSGDLRVLMRALVPLIGLAGLCGLFLSPWGTGTAAGTYLSSRLQRIGWHLKGDRSDTSEGVRLSAGPVAARYIANGGRGEGYGGTKEWLVKNTDLPEGRIHSIWAYISIAYGPMGLLLFVSAVFWRARESRSVAGMVAWGAAGFATGHLIFYYIWGLWLAIAGQSRKTGRRGPDALD
ncbi:MAG: hypothetical protein ACYC4P_15280 [Thermoanaerobaculia bacterium]